MVRTTILAVYITFTIRSGLQAGDLVVLGNRAQLKAGMSVSPREMPVASGSDGER